MEEVNLISEIRTTAADESSFFMVTNKLSLFKIFATFLSELTTSVALESILDLE
jgi:hypothetical protein